MNEEFLMPQGEEPIPELQHLGRFVKCIRNKPKYRQDHSSVSIGRNGKGYFVMVVDEAELDAFPQILVREANEAAAKMYGMRKQA